MRAGPPSHHSIDHARRGPRLQSVDRTRDRALYVAVVGVEPRDDFTIGLLEALVERGALAPVLLIDTSHTIAITLEDLDRAIGRAAIDHQYPER